MDKPERDDAVEQTTVCGRRARNPSTTGRKLERSTKCWAKRKLVRSGPRSPEWRTFRWCSTLNLQIFSSQAHTFAFVRVRALAAAVNSPAPRLALPSFQRDAVWDERHVELLWDSILRGFPIGAILLARGAGPQTRVLQRSRMAVAAATQESDEALVLIDGQQRSIAIAMGFRPWSDGDPCRLWLDLAAPSNEKDAAKFRVVLCSVRHPWGQGATEAQKRDARSEASAFGDDADPELPSLAMTWPVRAKVPVPLAAFQRLVAEGRQAEWQGLLPVALRGDGEQLALAATSFEAATTAVRALDHYCVPAVLLGDLDPDELGTAFQRLNRQGVEMSADDLFFSGLKMRWPHAHDLVWQIHGDPQVGKFLSPTQVVHLASRLSVRFRMDGQPDLPRLDVEKFRKLAGDSTARDGSAFLDGVKHYLLPRDDGAAAGRLHAYLRLARSVLAYRPDKFGDPGLPAPLIARLHWRVWHTVAAWLDASGCHDVADPDRMEILRFALNDLFCVRRHSDTLARALMTEVVATTGSFPGRAIDTLLRQEDANFVENALPDTDGYARRVLDESVPPCRDILQNERLLAMWVQRHALAVWFPHFDPTLFARADDLPFDVDHILPAAHVERRGRRNSVAPQFWSWRDTLSNNVGNFRYWPKGENRADGDRNPRDKLLLGEENVELPPTSSLRKPPYNMRTFGDVRMASHVPEAHVEDWTVAASGSAGNYDWKDETRIVAWRRAVMKRRAAMYAEMFQVLDFAAWTRDAPATPQASEGAAL